MNPKVSFVVHVFYMLCTSSIVAWMGNYMILVYPYAFNPIIASDGCHQGVAEAIFICALLYLIRLILFLCVCTFGVVVSLNLCLTLLRMWWYGVNFMEANTELSYIKWWYNPREEPPKKPLIEEELLEIEHEVEEIHQWLEGFKLNLTQEETKKMADFESSLVGAVHRKMRQND